MIFDPELRGKGRLKAEAVMNLPGPQQRLAMRGVDSGDNARELASPVLSRSRPAFGNAKRVRTTLLLRSYDAPAWLPFARTEALHVRDELYGNAGGSLTRRISILITDGPQSEPDAVACGRSH
jgi:hypothetical protein